MSKQLDGEDVASGALAIGGIGCGAGCCLGAIILVFFSRLMLLYGWLFSNWYDAFESKFIAVLGWIFAPWTSLAWMYIWFNNGGEIEGEYLIALIVGIIIDIGSWGSSSTASNSKNS